MPVPQYQVLNWTINNPTELDFEHVRSAVKNGHCKYVVFCHEYEGEEWHPEHTYHLQGFASAYKKHSVSAWHKILGQRWGQRAEDLVVRNIPASIQYAMGFKDGEKKEGSAEFEEFGAYQPGARSDILGVKRRIDDGEHYMRIARDSDQFGTVGRMHGFLQKYESFVRSEDRIAQGFAPPHTYIRCGTGDVSKTTFIYQKHGFADVWKWNCDMGKFFDGYCGQPVVVFEDVQKGQIPPLSRLKHLLDGYPERVGCKNDPIGVTWRAKYIYFTANERPVSWFDYPNDDHYNAFMSRIESAVQVYTDQPEDVFHTSTRYKRYFDGIQAQEDLNAQAQVPEEEVVQEEEGVVEENDPSSG